MANTITVKSTSYQGRYMYVTCTQTPDIASNTSTIAWTLTVTGGSSNYYSTGPTTVTINGTQVYYAGRLSYSTYKFPAGKGSVSGSIKVPHNTDGSKSITVSISTAIYNSTVQTSSSTWVLDDIPRFATITAAPNFNDEENPTITYSNPAGNAVDSLQACISLDGVNDSVAYRDISKTGTSYTFNLTDAERDVLRAATTGSNSRTVHFYVRTTIGSAYEGSNLSRTFTIKDPKPTISPTIIDSNSTTVALTGDSSKLVKFYSNAQITMGASAVKKATLTSKKVTCGSKSLTADGTINAIESGTFTFTATDNRGNTTTQDVTPSFAEYVKLSCNMGNSMPTGEGNMTVKVSGNYFNGSFGAVSNTLAVYYRYKVDGGTYSSWAAMTITKSGNTYSATASLTGLNYQAAYVFQAYAVDKLATVYSVERKVKAEPVFDWSGSDFKFNVPVYDRFGQIIDNGLAVYSGSGDSAVDPDTALDHLVLTNKNTPTSAFYFVETLFYAGKGDSNNKAQIAIPYNSAGSAMYHRWKQGGVWGAWSSLPLVVEEGTSGIWTYKKYASGKVELQGAFSVSNLACTAALGSMFRTDAFTIDAFPFTVTDPRLVASYESSGYGGFLWATTTTTTTSPPSYYLIRPTSATIASGKITFHVIGRWK